MTFSACLRAVSASVRRSRSRLGCFFGQLLLLLGQLGLLLGQPLLFLGDLQLFFRYFSALVARTPGPWRYRHRG